jgi:Ras-related protein Rab-5C
MADSETVTGSRMYSGGDLASKLIILGEASVGKTSILDQWLNGTFSEDTAPTIGAGVVTVPLMIDGTVMTFKVWDTAGTEQFRSVIPMYCREAAIAILVFDLTQPQTLTAVNEWYKFLRESADPVILLVGNKLDLVDARAIDHENAVDFAQKLECEYVEMSACTREGIDEFIRAVMDCARASLGKTCVHTPNTVGPATAPQQSGCAC